MSKIGIPISSIASLVGLDYYNNFAKTVCNVWAKYDKPKFTALESKYRKSGVNIATDSDYTRAARIDKKYGLDITESIKNINSTKQSSEDVAKKQQELIDTIKANPAITDDHKADIIAKIASSTNKMLGVHNEADILTAFEREYSCKIVKRQFNLEYPICKLNDINWCVVGKCDGLTDKNELVEAKKRIAKLFGTLRDYENIQVQLYMAALDIRQGYLIESHSSSASGVQVNIIPVSRDDNLISGQIISRLNGFTRFFGDFMRNPDWQNALILGDKDKTIYKIYESYWAV
jgi:hypothetical protein